MQYFFTFFPKSSVEILVSFVKRCLVDKSGSHKRASNSYNAVTARHDRNALEW